MTAMSFTPMEAAYVIEVRAHFLAGVHDKGKSRLTIKERRELRRTNTRRFKALEDELCALAPAARATFYAAMMAAHQALFVEPRRRMLAEMTALLNRLTALPASDEEHD